MDEIEKNWQEVKENWEEFEPQRRTGQRKSYIKITNKKRMTFSARFIQDNYLRKIKAIRFLIDRGRKKLAIEFIDDGRNNRNSLKLHIRSSADTRYVTIEGLIRELPELKKLIGIEFNPIKELNYFIINYAISGKR